MTLNGMGQTQSSYGDEAMFVFIHRMMEGLYRDLQTQLNFNPAAYAQTSAAARKAWRKIPMPGKRAEELTKIVQGCPFASLEVPAAVSQDVSPLDHEPSREPIKESLCLCLLMGQMPVLL